jgi:uncharacterized protein YbjT (DUF2867 family)
MILLTGATGYVGGRLLHRLEAAGRAVRCVARRPEYLRHRAAPTTEIVAGDVLDRASLDAAMHGVTVAYYLVHSMADREHFEEADRAAARTFGSAARAAGVRRIVYLGGLGNPGGDLSAHLRSRHETGVLLREAGVPVIELRASIVIGGGSLSFEMIRALVERLPVMITPRWVDVRAQPIAIGDVLAYLDAALELPGDDGRIFEIGGPDVVSYGDLMREYARQRGLRRIMIPVPVLTPRLSSLWLGLVTPVYARVGRALVDSIRHPTIVRDHAARHVFAIEPIGVREAIALALRNEDREIAETRWTDARVVAGPERPYGGVRFGNRLVDTRSVVVGAPAARAFQVIERIGGGTGWYHANWLWTVRGWLDLLVGGVGMRRGRRDPDHVAVGDVVDCWRVEAVEPGRRLRLQAEMKLPGRAWLTFEVAPDGTGSRITQTATFDPVGLAGLAYWYGVWPLHELVFRGMLREIAEEASQGST